MPEHATDVGRLVDQELTRLVEDGVTDEELTVAIGYLTGAYEMGLEDTGARMSRLGGMLATMGRVIPVDEQLERWEKVSRADVRRVIDRVYGAGRPVTVLVGPLSPALYSPPMRVGVSGAGGRMGSAVCAAVALDPELDLVAAVDPYAAGQMIEGMAVSGEPKAFVDAGAEVVVDFSVADAARRTVLWLAMHGIHTVVGTTGLTDEDLETFAHEFRGDGANCAVVPNYRSRRC